MSDGPPLCSFKHDTPTPAAYKLVCCPEDTRLACEVHATKWYWSYSHAVRV